MIRKAFVMRVHPDRHAEYECRHRPIWQELTDLLRRQGALNYSIHLDALTSTLFAYAEIEDEVRWAAIAADPVCQRWWAHMAEIMPANPDGSPVSRPLREVFVLE